MHRKNTLRRESPYLSSRENLRKIQQNDQCPRRKEVHTKVLIATEKTSFETKPLTANMELFDYNSFVTIRVRIDLKNHSARCRFKCI